MGRGWAASWRSASKISATELGKAHILRDRFAGQVAEVFQDIDVLLVPVWNTPMPGAAEWWRWRRARSRICCATRHRSI